MRGCGWVVRVVGDGKDKSDYHVIPVLEEPGTDPEFVTPARGRGLLFFSVGPLRSRASNRFPRNGATIWKYRAEARKDKKSRKWETNHNSWHNQRDDEGW